MSHSADDRNLLPICVLAGGLGSRLGSHVKDTPKPLLMVADQPFLLHQLQLLAQYGASRAVLCVGYRGEQIEEVVGYERFDVSIQYSYDGPDLDGTLGAVRRALPLLGERFLILYGDTYLRVDYGDFQRGWMASGCPGGMAVLQNKGRWDNSNVIYDANRVRYYSKREFRSEMLWIDYGLGAMTAGATHLVDKDVTDLSDLYSALAEQGDLYGFPASNRFYEIGTPGSLRETDEFLRSAQLSGAPPWVVEG